MPANDAPEPLFDPKALGRLRLVRVVYEFFPDEDEEFDDEFLDAEEHRLHREVRFELADGERLYVTWCSEPFQYSIAIAWRTDWRDDPHPTRDMSAHPLWSPIVGEQVELAFVDALHLALAVRAPESVLYLGTYDYPGGGDRGCWGMDVVRVMRKLPPLPPPW